MSGANHYQQVLELAEDEFQFCTNLPFAVYLVSKDGVFLRYNESCRKLFQLPKEPTYQNNVSSYYIHPKDRSHNLKRLRRIKPGNWLKDVTIDLRINGEVRYVKDYTKAIWDEDNKGIIGMISIIINITHGGRYDKLFNDLPIGVFSFRQDEGLVNANTKFLEMHGYDSFDEVYQKKQEDFSNSEIEQAELKYKLREEGRVINEQVEHIRKDGTVFRASVNAQSVKNPDGEIIGVEGFLEDISTSHMYFKLVNEVPIGLYKVKINARGEHIIEHCNHHFAKHRGAKSPAELIGEDIRKFHLSPAAFKRFHEALVDKDREGKYLVDYVLEAYNDKDELRKYEVHGKVLRDEQNRIVGRVGAERDITDFIETKDQLTELTTDIGKVLHSYSSTLIHSKHTMEAVFRSIISEELLEKEGHLHEQKTLAEISHEIKSLDHIIDRLIQKNEAIRHFSEDEIGHVSRIFNLLKGPADRQINIQQLALIRDGAIKIKEIVGDLSGSNFPKELIKSCRRQLEEILRLCSLVTLHRGVEAILEMETTVNNLRSFILTRVKEEEPLQRLDIYDLVQGVSKNMQEFAYNKNVEIRLNLRDIHNVSVDGYETDLVRALLNIVHNAIKYSWVRRGPSRAFVSIDGKKDKEWLYLNFENWGVAITEEEIKSGSIFEVGYRGINSSDRRRPGTGLGLYDSKKVIEKHKGILTITSEPTLGNPKDDYSNPFITRVSIQLPRNP